eukprot:COSAG01_NODE_52208_length_348_cov_0.867470_1_plen_22_part_10
MAAGGCCGADAVGIIHQLVSMP